MPLSFDGCPELSVIVPVYNEAASVARFLGELAKQREVRLELILSDGGSSDQTAPIALSLASSYPFSVSVIQGRRGRGAQMNWGAAHATASTLLFLHIDSSFSDPLALRKALDALAAAGEAAVAGHFALHFDLEGEPPLPYRFYAAKATLNRPGCTHGDQGLLIAARFFRELGGFDPALPLMEDTFLADRIRREGSLILLPSRIITSARRFLAEGLRPRQTLNAILMNLAHIGHLDLILSLKECYRSQDQAMSLALAPFLTTLKREIAQLPAARRRRLWLETGRYIRCNAWQIAFFLDLLLGKVGPGRGGSCLALHDRFVQRLLDNGLADRATAALTWLWFRLALATAK